jgi:phosphotriesterase-related protein
MIQTVLGKITKEELGVCLTHEHVWCDQSLGPRFELFDNSRDFNSFMRLRDYDKQEEELKIYEANNGNSIVEVTCEGWGRDLDVLASLSKSTKVNIVATTGFYVEPCIPKHAYDFTVEKLSDYLIREIEQGNENGVKCGILKSAINTARVEGIEEKGLKAVSRAQKATGVSITTHTTGSRRQEIPGGNASYEIQEILLSEGVKANKLIFGHVDERPDINRLIESAKSGSFIQFDTIGKENWMLDRTRAKLVKAMVDEGCIDKILLSQDRNREYEMNYGGNLGYVLIFKSFIEKLLAENLTKSQINQIIIENPKIALSKT